MSKNDASKPKIVRAIDYFRENMIEQKLEEFICQIVHERPADPYGVLANQFATNSKPPTIAQIKGREVILSTGRPSLAVDVYANMLGRVDLIESSTAPIGTSVFSQEPKLCLDTNNSRFLGLGSKNAMNYVEIVSASLQGKSFTNINDLDQQIKKVLEDKTGVSNVLTAISFALAKASAVILKKPLFLYIYESINPQQAADHFSVPTPVVTLLQGGMHANSPLMFESIYIVPKTSMSYIEQLRICTEVSYKMKDKVSKNNEFYIGKNGGFACEVTEVSAAVALVEKTIKEAGFTVGNELSIGIDCAATYIYDQEKQMYQVEKGVFKSSTELVQYYIDLVTHHPSIRMINDGISDLDYRGWEMMRDALTGRVKLYGGDVYGSQSTQSKRGLRDNWTDGILLQPGQAGTLSDAAETGILFKQKGKHVIVARRSGETCDTVIADFAVAIEADFLMAGCLIGSEGVEKYNHLLRIYEYLRDQSMLR